MRILHNGFIPKSKAKHVIVGSDTPQSFINGVLNLGIEIIKIKPVSALSPMVSGHADMLLLPLGDNRFVAARELSGGVKDSIEKAGGRVISGRSTLSCNYPYDIAYNIARVGKFAFHRSAFSDPFVKESFDKSGILLVDVKQGYTKCSTCIVTDEAIITSDKSIEKAAEKLFIDVLLIREGYIELSGASYGFIGGATGLIDGKTLISCGRIEDHPDFHSIKSFCLNHGIDVFGIGDHPAKDIGSIIAIT